MPHREWYGEHDGKDWKADFVELMLSVQDFNYSAMPGAQRNDPPAVYSVRRDDSGQWHACLTEVSRRGRFDQLAAAITAGEKYDGPAKGAHADTQNLRRTQLAELEQPPTWQPLRNDIAGPLESQYQRFLRHHTES